MPSREPAIAAREQESFGDEVRARAEPVRIDTGSQPVGFGSLMDAPSDKEAEDELDFLPQAHSELPERDWRDPDTEELDEEAEEEKPAAPWRHDDEAESHTNAGSSGGAKDWRAGSFEQILAKKIPIDSWEPVDDKPEVVEKAPAANKVVTQAPVAQAPTSKTAPVTGTIRAAQFASDTWEAESSPVSQEKSSRETATAVEEVKQVKQKEPASSPEAAVASLPEAKQAEPPAKTPKDSWFSVPSNPWDTEIEKANKLPSPRDATPPLAPPRAASIVTEKATEALTDATPQVIEEADLPAAAVEA